MKVLEMLQIAVIAALAWSGQAYAGVPYPNATTPQAVDLGALREQAGTTPISITIALRLPNLSDAEKLLQSLHTPQDPLYHQFLTPEQFVARFAPPDADVANVVASLQKYGLTAERATSTTLKVTGLPADVERAFAVSLHSYSVPAHANAAAYTFHAPLTRATVPAEISAAVAGVFGLDTRPSWHPRHRTAPFPMRPVATTATTVQTGNLTVLDFAKQYDVGPLYRRGLTGAGRTLGIMTFASFTPSDAFKYWSALGLKVDPHRLSIVNVDGGPGAPSDASGSLETTIDVEQSGGIAPGAKIVVYQGPNTTQAFVDVFAAAIDANLAETLSVSWGDWEWLQNIETSPVVDPITGKTVSTLQAGHELFVRAAIQGQTLFAASGDGGAYDVNNDLGCFGPYSPKVPASCSQPLTVDYPASDPAITGAGGTTLPGTQDFCLNKACTQTYSLTITRQRVWGWDYLEGLCKALGTPNPVTCGIFPGGSGGGVSVFFEKPLYQAGLSGTQVSQPGQVFEIGKALATSLGLGADYFALPARYPGRNVPDISFNADPDTGYEVYYTSNVNGFSVQDGWGGTSFVAPELNGVSALLGEELHSRIGLLNYPLYGLASKGKAYGGPTPPIHAIPYGDNWFYQGSNGYNPAVGLGTLDVANFADALRDIF
jgi:subtilase family serine protease